MSDGQNLQLFQEDSRVSRSPLPGSDEAAMMTATSGRSCYESWKSYSRPGWLAKTFLDSFLSATVWKSTICLLRWKLETTRRGYSIIRLRASVPTTSGTGFSLWPTARTAGLIGGSGSKWMMQQMVVNGQIEQLEAEQMAGVKMWATPHSSCATGAGEHGAGGMNIQTAVKMWPTPRASDGEEGGPNQRDSKGNYALPGEVHHRPSLLPTPRATRGGSATETVEQLQESGQLNPDWVEWLMGFPANWTEVD